MKKLAFLFIVIAQTVVSQTADSLFVKANDLYKNGNYQEAVKTYETIRDQGVESSELYFNIGNCYYKLNKVAPTIYNYEKALMIDPLNKDAQNNLVFARRLTIDTIEALPKSVLQKLDDAFVKKLSYDQWAIAAVCFSILGSLFFLLFYFSETSSKKRLYFITSGFAFFALALSVLAAYKEQNFAKSNIHAIIFTQKIDIKNAPTTNSDVVFTLHEGTKVKILDRVDAWQKIKIADGQVGWIPVSDLKALN